MQPKYGIWKTDMPAKVSRRLVIDASVARSAGGEDARYPISKYCRDFLKATLKICHRIVMTPDIVDEWKKHQSRFARQWRVSMEARKKVERIEAGANDELRRKIVRVTNDDQGRAAMLKDSCLVEAAIATDGIVVSLDEAARRLFAETSRSVSELEDVVWVNPCNEEEQPILWLLSGAQPEKRRLLGPGT